MEDIFDVRVLNCHLMTYSVHDSTLFIMKQMPPITNKLSLVMFKNQSDLKVKWPKMSKRIKPGFRILIHWKLLIILIKTYYYNCHM